MLGFGYALNPDLSLAFPFLLLLFSQKENALSITAVALVAFSFGKLHYQAPPLPDEPLEGIAEVSIENVYQTQTHGHPIWVYQCTLSKLITDEKTYTFNQFPCTIRIPKGKRPKAHSIYHVQGKLKAIAPRRYSLSIPRTSTWEPVEKINSLVEWRYRTKTKLHHYISKNIPHKSSAHFLAGIATGQFDDAYLSYEFGRFGLKHIMAISGFHFAIIAMIVNALLRLFLPIRISSILLLLSLSAYFILLGPRPSVLRAFTMIAFALTGHLVGKQANGLNALGLALFIILLYNPLMIENLGFQFSFAITASILIFYPRLTQLLTNPRPYYKVMQMPLADQHGYLLLSFFRQGVILTLAVHIIAIPLSLYFFGKFAWMGLFYNLFFPFAVSFSMLLLLLALLFFFLPPLQSLLFTLCDTFTLRLIDLTYQMPLSVDYILYTNLSSTSTIILLSLLFYLGLKGPAKEEFVYC